MFSLLRVPGVTVSLCGNKTLTKTPSFMPLIVGLMFLLSKSHTVSGFIQTFIMVSVYLLCSERFPGIINGKGRSPDFRDSTSAGLVLSTSHCSWRQILLLLRIRNSQPTRNKFNNILEVSLLQFTTERLFGQITSLKNWLYMKNSLVINSTSIFVLR